MTFSLHLRLSLNLGLKHFQPVEIFIIKQHLMLMKIIIALI